MKSIFGYLAVAALGLLPWSAAQAQTSMYGIGTCTASSDMSVMLTGDTQLSIGTQLIPQAAATAVFNQAECQCGSRDIFMHFNLKTGTGTGVAPPVAEMYIGEAECDEYSMRSTRVCDQVTTTSVPNNTKWSLAGTSFQTIGQFDVPIPPEAVTNPKPAAGMGYICKTAGITNATISVTVGPPMNPAVCSMPVAVNTVGPTAPVNVTLSSGDSGMVVNWDVANAGGIENYQVLCRKVSDPTVPVMSSDFLTKTRYYFSTCIQSHLFRRLPGNLTGVPSDAATDTATVSIDGGNFPVDPRLRCSDRVAATGTMSGQVRINGLTNGEEYEVMVVSIDAYGNATPSMTAKAKPQETAASLGEYCDGDNCPGFGCSAGQAARRGGAAGTVLFGLGALALLLARRARRAA